MVNMQGLAAMGIGALILAVVFMVSPMIGEQIDNAYTPGAASQWNATVNTDLTTGAGFWTDIAAILVVAALVVVVGSGIIKSLMTSFGQ